MAHLQLNLSSYTSMSQVPSPLATNPASSSRYPIRVSFPSLCDFYPEALPAPNSTLSKTTSSRNLQHIHWKLEMAGVPLRNHSLQNMLRSQSIGVCSTLAKLIRKLRLQVKLEDRKVTNREQSKLRSHWTWVQPGPQTN